MKNVPLEKALIQAGIKWLVTPRAEIILTQIADLREQRAALSIQLQSLVKENGFNSVEDFKKSLKEEAQCCGFKNVDDYLKSLEN